MTAYLIDVESSEQYQIKEPMCKVGASASNNIVLSAPYVHSEHVKIECKSNEFYAALAPGATNTRKFLFFFDIPTAAVNGRVLQAKPTKLSAGDKIQVGSRLLQLQVV